jgi:hypothetical protein
MSEFLAGHIPVVADYLTDVLGGHVLLVRLDCTTELLGGGITTLLKLGPTHGLLGYC